jgi:hypothetical protein
LEEALKLHKLKHKCGFDFNDQVDVDALKQKSKPQEKNYMVISMFILFIANKN